MINANLTSNGQFSPPGGFPFSLNAGETTVQAFVPKGTVSVVAQVKPDYVADLHLALYTAPSVSNGDDGTLVTQVDSLAVTTAGATLTVTIPASTDLTPVAPKEYVVRLWFDNALGGVTDTVARDSAVTDVTKQSLIPFGVSVLSFSVT